MKKNAWALIGVVVVVALVVSGTNIAGIDFGQWNPFPTNGNGNLVNVSKTLRFHITDAWGGGALASKTDKFNLYDSDGQTIIEANEDTDANGLCDTGSDYPSGKVVYLRYEDSNDKAWWKVTVPKMNPADAESATYNIIKLRSVLIGTYTDTLQIANGTTYADAATYYMDADGENPVFTYEIANTGSDNTGILDSYDPLYGQDWSVEFHCTASGTDYEKLVYHGFDYEFTQGTTRYMGKVLDPYVLTKHKVGANYLSLGTDKHTFWVDTSGDTASTAVTFQISIKIYASHTYAQAHGGNYGVESYEICESTLTIDSTT